MNPEPTVEFEFPGSRERYPNLTPLHSASRDSVGTPIDVGAGDSLSVANIHTQTHTHLFSYHFYLLLRKNYI